jgi:type II secretory pathway component PulF
VKRETVTLRFVEMLNALVESDVSLIDALHILFQNDRRKEIRSVCGSILQNMKRGLGFSDSIGVLAGNRLYFPHLYRILLKAAEITGSLDFALENILRDLKRRQKAQEALAAVMVYPAIIVAIAFAGTMALAFKGIPLFEASGFIPGAMLAGAVRGIVWAGVFLLLCGSILFAVYFHIFGRDSPEYRIFSLISLLLQGNVSLADALSHCISSMERSKYARALVSVKRDLAVGTKLSQAFAQTSLFPSYVTGWLSVADESGSLGNSFINITDHLARQDENKRAVASKCIEPAVIIITGVYLLLLIVNVVMPLLTSIGGML